MCWDTQWFFGGQEICFKSEACHRYSASECWSVYFRNIIYMKYFIFLRFYSYKTWDGGAIIKTWQMRSLWPECGTTEVQNTKQSGLVIAMHVWGECQCVWDQVVTVHTALLLSDIFYVLVLFLLYFYCLLNRLFWLCFVWSSVKEKFWPEKHSENIAPMRKELVPC